MQMGTPTLTVMGRRERVVAFVCGAFCVWWSCANLFWFFFLYCIQLSTTSRKFTPLSYSLLHLFRITSAVLRRCFVASALLRRCFCVALVLLPHCFGVASALLRHSFGVPSASALLRGRALQLRCNFGATSAQPWLNNAFGSTKTSRPAAPMLICVIFGLPVVCKNGSC